MEGQEGALLKFFQPRKELQSVEQQAEGAPGGSLAKGASGGSDDQAGQGRIGSSSQAASLRPPPWGSGTPATVAGQGRGEVGSSSQAASLRSPPGQEGIPAGRGGAGIRGGRGSVAGGRGVAGAVRGPMDGFMKRLPPPQREEVEDAPAAAAAAAAVAPSWSQLQPHQRGREVPATADEEEEEREEEESDPEVWGAAGSQLGGQLLGERPLAAGSRQPGGPPLAAFTQQPDGNFVITVSSSDEDDDIVVQPRGEGASGAGCLLPLSGHRPCLPQTAAGTRPAFSSPPTAAASERPHAMSALIRPGGGGVISPPATSPPAAPLFTGSGGAPLSLSLSTPKRLLSAVGADGAGADLGQPSGSDGREVLLTSPTKRVHCDGSDGRPEGASPTPDAQGGGSGLASPVSQRDGGSHTDQRQLGGGSAVPGRQQGGAAVDAPGDSPIVMFEVAGQRAWQPPRHIIDLSSP